MNHIAILSVWVAPAALLTIAACEQTFDPIDRPEGAALSIHGFLDASPSADTQWVRVGAIRDGIHTSPESIEMVVALEDLNTGDVTVLHDSLFVYPQQLGSELHAYNFWTTDAIEPGTTYRLTATRADGSVASATVPVPDTFSTITVRRRPDVLVLEGVEHVAMVEVLVTVPDECVERITVFRAYQPMFGASMEEGVYSIPIRPGELPFPCDAPASFQQIHLVASGSAWPYDPMLDANTLGHMNAVSNVENGVGFVGGVVTKTIPFESCFLIGAPCELIYGPESASLEGMMRDIDCGGTPIGGYAGTVVLTEIESGKSRPRGSDRDGFFRIEALTPGVAHELRATAVTGPPPDGLYQPYVDTLVFETSEEVTMDLPLRRFQGHCPNG